MLGVENKPYGSCAEGSTLPSLSSHLPGVSIEIHSARRP